MSDTQVAPTQIQTPKVAVDAVLFTVDKNELKVLLIKIKEGPYKDKWCIPGGLVYYDEPLETAVKRIVFQKTNISDVYLEQLYTFGDPKRDIRSRSISAAYFALLNKTDFANVKTAPYYETIEWHSVGNLPEMAFDHKLIIETAHQRLKAKLGYTNIVYNLVPNDFTLTQLQGVYEIILGQKLDKRNFRKKLFALDLVAKSEKILTGQPFRPAQLFHFTKREMVFF